MSPSGRCRDSSLSDRRGGPQRWGSGQRAPALSADVTPFVESATWSRGDSRWDVALREMNRATRQTMPHVGQDEQASGFPVLLAPTRLAGLNHDGIKDSDLVRPGRTRP